MRVNKTLKSLAIALPLFALAACSSTSDSDAQSSVDSNTQSSSQVDDTVQVSAAQKTAAIEEQKRQQLDQLRREHIIYFDFDMSRVSSDFATILDAHAKYLNENSTVNVLIEGHADERGTPEYNIALGERRAKAVASYLENMGVSSAQISIVSYGEEKPMVKGHTEAAFAKNRRAVLVY
ncbi:MAG: peptidoglycan-associated lipoprotein Pal [Alteromonadaceae bacterium]|nr:peptidoglycan-associated lipoprotein Pal [Alteromonadaceae bacterium]